jgi:small subunit ribosomal protein S3
VHPTGFRLGVIKSWESRWYADRNYKDLLAEDRKLRETIYKQLRNAAISRVEIERVAGTQISIAIHTAKPGIVIGKSGESVERLRQQLEGVTKKKVRLSILEIRNPEVDATLVARSIAEQLEKRISFRRAMKQAVQKSMRQGAKGIKVVMGGRLGGAEIARVEKEVDGSVPLQTLRADIDYGQTEAHTTYGRIGIKVWIYHGDVLPDRQGGARVAATPAAIPQPGDRMGRGGDRMGRGGDRMGRGGDRRGGERAGGERGGGERGGTGVRRAPGAGVPGGGTGGGARAPRSGAQGTRGGGGGGTRAPRPPQAQSSGPIAGGTETTPGPITPAPSAPIPEGTIETGKGPELPSSGPVTPAPAAHEFPAPTANKAENPDETPRREPETEE